MTRVSERHAVATGNRRGIFLPKEDWKGKNSPRFIVAGITKTHGFRYDWGWKADGTGWLFRRIA